MAVIRAVFLDDHLNVGGTTTFLIKLIPALRAFGIAATVVASDAFADMEDDARRAGVPLIQYPFQAGKALYDDVLLPAYQRVADLQPHVIIANHETVSFDLLRYVPPGILRIGVVHLDDDWSYRLVSAYVAHLDIVVCVAAALADRTVQAAATGSAGIVVIPNGVAVPDALPHVAPSLHGELRILYVGRLEERQKRVRRFVPLWNELCKASVPVCWTIVGDGPESDYLRAGMHSDSLHRVVFAGAVPQDGVQAYYEMNHIILLMSDYEGLPLALLEGMSQGLVPVVTAQRNGVSDLVDSRCGIVVPQDDIETAARAILSLQPGHATFEVLRAAAWRKIVAHHSLQAMAVQWSRLLLSRNPCGTPIWPATKQILGPPKPQAPRHHWVYAPALRPVRRIASRVLQYTGMAP